MTPSGRFAPAAYLAAVLVLTPIGTSSAAKDMIAPESGTPPPCVGDWPDAHSACRPIPLRSVKLSGFLGSHVDANNRASIPAGLKSPIPRAFEARADGREPPPKCRRLATDSDFYKWLEGACYAIAYDSSLKELARAVDHYAEILIKLQEPDGYLGTRISPAVPFDTKVRHDLYCAGHFIEAAVAHFKATGKRDLLNAACSLADFYRRALEQNHPYFQIVGSREHPEIELALVRLHRATGERRFLDLAAAITRMSRIGPTIADVQAGGGSRHAVRLCYLLTGSAELHLDTGDRAFFAHLPALWNEIITTRMYVTGGIGYNESIPLAPFDLPQCLEDNTNRDIAETCASVSLMMLSWRMHAIAGDARAFDVIETILYNHYLGAISPDHLGNFYYNPLRRVGDLTHRTDHGGNPVRRTTLPAIHSTACCMPNAWRFFAQLPEYVFSLRGNDILVSLYTDAVAKVRLPDGTDVMLETRTRYPHEGGVSIRVACDRPARFGLGLRVPAWCTTASVTVAGQTVRARPGEYHRVDREWMTGDEVVLDLPMQPTVIIDRPEVVANRGQAAFRRGPLVYCLERQDAAGIVLEKAVAVLDRENPSRSVAAEYRPDLGKYVLRLPARERPGPTSKATPGSATTASAEPDPREVTLIPFYFRANRQADPRWITFIPCE